MLCLPRFHGALENIYTNAKVHELLLYSVECLIDEKEEAFACKFLSDESGRDRIYQAREDFAAKISVILLRLKSSAARSL